jgi:hypothetical protein
MAARLNTHRLTENYSGTFDRQQPQGNIHTYNTDAQQQLGNISAGFDSFIHARPGESSHVEVTQEAQIEELPCFGTSQEEQTENYSGTFDPAARVRHGFAYFDTTQHEQTEHHSLYGTIDEPSLSNMRRLFDPSSRARMNNASSQGILYHDQMSHPFASASSYAGHAIPIHVTLPTQVRRLFNTNQLHNLPLFQIVLCFPY